VAFTTAPPSTKDKERVELYFRTPSLPMAGYRVIVTITFIIIIIIIIIEAHAFLLRKLISFRLMFS